LRHQRSHEASPAASGNASTNLAGATAVDPVTGLRSWRSQETGLTTRGSASGITSLASTVAVNDPVTGLRPQSARDTSPALAPVAAVDLVIGQHQQGFRRAAISAGGIVSGINSEASAEIANTVTGPYSPSVHDVSVAAGGISASALSSCGASVVIHGSGTIHGSHAEAKSDSLSGARLHHGGAESTGVLHGVLLDAGSHHSARRGSESPMGTCIMSDVGSCDLGESEGIAGKLLHECVGRLEAGPAAADSTSTCTFTRAAKPVADGLVSGARVGALPQASDTVDHTARGASSEACAVCSEGGDGSATFGVPEGQAKTGISADAAGRPITPTPPVSVMGAVNGAQARAAKVGRPFTPTPPVSMVGGTPWEGGSRRLDENPLPKMGQAAIGSLSRGQEAALAASSLLASEASMRLGVASSDPAAARSPSSLQEAATTPTPPLGPVKTPTPPTTTVIAVEAHNSNGVSEAQGHELVADPLLGPEASSQACELPPPAQGKGGAAEPRELDSLLASECPGPVAAAQVPIPAGHAFASADLDRAPTTVGPVPVAQGPEPSSSVLDPPLAGMHPPGPGSYPQSRAQSGVRSPESDSSGDVAVKRRCCCLC